VRAPNRALGYCRWIIVICEMASRRLWATQPAGIVKRVIGSQPLA
jgi:hypothetical protein